jgi:lysophospholipase L1-like esterase
MRDYPLPTVLAIVLTGAVALWIYPPNPAAVRGLLEFSPALTPASPLVRHVVAVPVRTLPAPAPGSKLAAEPLLDDSAGALDRFYGALRRTSLREPGAITRILHYGDSPTTADLITGDIRSLLQARFGNAGHGFILPAKPWAWYQHNGVRASGSGWQAVPATHFEARDGMFGLGGVSFTGGTSAESKIVYEKAAYRRFEVWYLEQPDGGKLSVSAGESLLGDVDTAGDGKTPGFAEFEAPSGTGSLTLKVTAGHVRLFGVTAENPTAGLVYDTVGLNGASITVLSRMFNQGHWTAELQHRNPNLVVINYGTNEADFPAFIDKQYEKELREAIRRVRAALPSAAVLIMGPMDRGHKASSGDIETMPTIPRIVALQRRVAHETGCAFFDTYQAMGGEGTMARWYAAQPRLVSADFIHPYPAGGRIIAEVFAHELVSGLNRFILRESRKKLKQ